MLAAVLALALVPAVHTVRTHSHGARGVAVLAANVSLDTGHSGGRADTHGLPADTPALHCPEAGSARTSDPCTDIRSGTARAPQVRGPPGQPPA